MSKLPQVGREIIAVYNRTLGPGIEEETRYGTVLYVPVSVCAEVYWHFYRRNMVDEAKRKFHVTATWRSYQTLNAALAAAIKARKSK